MRIRIYSLVLSLLTFVAWGCGSNDAPETNTLVKTDDAQREFWSREGNRERLAAYVRANARFTLLHEMAHYMFDVLQVPIAGREEDAADRLAALLMMPRDAGNGPEAELTSSPSASDLIWVAYSWINFGRGALDQDRQRMTWYDEHSVDEQRGYDVLCLVYGNNPKRFELAARDPEIGIPDEQRLRAFMERCGDESARNAFAFKKLVGAYIASNEEINRKLQEYLARFQQTRQSGSSAAAIVRSGSSASAIVQGDASQPATGSLLMSQPPGVFYEDFTSTELWWRVPWFPWDSAAFLKSHKMLEAVRDNLFALTLPADQTIPSIEAKSCRGMANAFYGIDANELDDRPDRVNAVKRGLIKPSIVVCYPLIDAFSWAGRTLIWRSEQERAKKPGA